MKNIEEKYIVGTPFLSNVGEKWYPVLERCDIAIAYNKKIEEEKKEKSIRVGSIPMIEWFQKEFFRTREECEDFIKSKIDN